MHPRAELSTPFATRRMCRRLYLSRRQKGRQGQHAAARRSTSAAGDAAAPRARSVGVAATHEPRPPRSIKAVVDAGYGRFSAANKQAAAERRSRRYDERRGITADASGDGDGLRTPPSQRPVSYAVRARARIGAIFVALLLTCLTRLSC